MKYLEYAKHINADEYLIKWVSTTLKNYVEKASPTTEEVEHVLDYLVQSNKRISKMSYEQALKLTKEWDKAQQKKGNNINELDADTEVILDFKDGFKIVKLVGENAYKREGFLMRHCVASYFGKDVEIYSLRDTNNMPHCTMEKDQQVKGKGNGDIHPKYINYVVKFLEHVDMSVGDSEMEHLGYLNFEKVKDELHEDTNFYNDVYLPKDEKLKDKDGDEFMNLDLLDIKPLISEDEETTLKVNFTIPALVTLSIEYLKKKIGKEDSGHYSQLATSGHSSKLATSGDYSKLATSGHYSKLATSGDSSQLATSGDSSKLATSGHYSKLATSGDYSKLATSGHYSKLATSGDSSKLATSGHYSQLATSGHSSQLATSGDYSKLAMTGEKSVGANIGYKGKIKGIIGNWITLAEYDDNYKILCVKSIMIDGEKIKADTWYALEDGEFIEMQ